MSTEHVASSIFLHVCQVVYCLVFLHVCQILRFTISSNQVLPIFVFCFFPMKMSPNIMQAPPMWSNSLYFHNGCSIGKRNDSKTAHVHFRRILTANRDMSVIKAKLASDQQLGPTPAVRLKSKWQRKWDELQDTVTPHQMVDMQLARRIFRLNIWKWEKVRIAAGSCLRSVFI